MTPANRSTIAALDALTRAERDDITCTFRPLSSEWYGTRCHDLAVVSKTTWNRLCERHERIARRTATNRDRRHGGAFYIDQHVKYQTFDPVALIKGQRERAQADADTAAEAAK